MMTSVVTMDNIRDFGYVNMDFLKNPPKGMIVAFFPLGGSNLFMQESKEGEFFAEHDLLYVAPFANPWGWMNEDHCNFTDEMVDLLVDYYGYEMPLVYTGGSMGGYSSIMYSIRAKRAPIGCVTNCPACDLTVLYDEVPFVKRTLYSAYYEKAKGDPCKLRELIGAASPVNLADKMLDIPYHVFQGDADEAVRIQKHSDVFVKAMQEAGKNISYYVVPGGGHCDLGGRYEEYRKIITDMFA